MTYSQTPPVLDLPAAALPRVILRHGIVVGLDVTGLAAPATSSTTVLRTTLRRGTSALVEGTGTVTLDYLCLRYGAERPLDQTYGSTPTTFAIDDLIPGLRAGLVGVRVGSRVVLQIPPDAAYADTPAEDLGFPPTSTVCFVVDVIGTDSAAAQA
ncbi:FKBP-type peptidyl-prolyl cis-trans isomerase [Nocardioides sp.]|uniref:FKBP-type peptidyl-prolyl cis-trans isomerase n=1 Tax=Nocardioides sp. TaxID=35761 RepID=UPI0026157441|nr:FKBP-type peptidyl-prolyl cis-trans isomerase [Nocardioides sp.]